LRIATDMNHSTPTAGTSATSTSAAMSGAALCSPPLDLVNGSFNYGSICGVDEPSRRTGFLTKHVAPACCTRMSIEQIQREVGQLTDAERQQLSAWILATYPPRSVENLVSRAEQQARRGEWTPLPPSDDNFPTGEALGQALKRVKSLGLGR